MILQEKISEIKKITNGYKAARLLSASVNLNIFNILNRAPKTLEEISTILNIKPENLSTILNALVCYKFVELHQNAYRLDEFYDVLNPDSPNNQLGYIRHATTMSNKWAYLADAVIDKELTLKNFNDITGNEVTSTKAFIQAMEANARPQARFIVEQFDFSNHTTLDVGAGAGTYSIVMGRNYPTSKGVLFDLPAVSEIICDNIVKNELSNRFSVISGDYNVSLPDGSFDDIFLFAVAHQEDDKNIESLLTRLYEKLNNGGRLFLSSFFLNNDRISPEFSVMFALEMLIMSTKGTVYTHEEIQNLISSAGFSDIKRIDEIPGPSTLYIAKK